MQSIAEGTFQKLDEGQQRLVMKQLELSEAQASVESNIAKNIEQLMQEKMLIAAGNRELMKMTETIHEKLGMIVLPTMRLYSNVFEYSVFSLKFNLIEVYANFSMVSEMLVLMVCACKRKCFHFNSTVFKIGRIPKFKIF